MKQNSINMRIIFHETEEFIKWLIPDLLFFFFILHLTCETRISSTKYLDLSSYIKENTLHLDHNHESMKAVWENKPCYSESHTKNIN
jgi:hypothetical protein